MGGASANRNPFRPGTGNPPPFLAGRDAEIALARRRLGELAGGTPPSQGVLCYGPRGNGKTAILHHVASEARDLGLRVEKLPVDTLRDRERITTELQERSGHAGSRVTGVQFGPLGASADPALRTRNLFRLFSAWVESSPTPLVILLDEVQRIVPEVGGAFFDAVQHGVANTLPFVVFAAGTPDAPSRLRESATYLERAFERRRIGRLTREAAVAALAEPARAAGRPMSSGAQRCLGEASQDYPYFIQLLGSAAWDAAQNHPVISEAAAQQGIEQARPLLLDFYGQRVVEAEDRGLADTLVPLAEFFFASGGQVEHAALREVLERQPRRPDVEGSWTSLRASLLALGILWERTPGVWEMGIPSFGSYLLDQPRSPLPSNGAATGAP